MNTKLNSCVKSIRALNLDALIVSNPTNINYISGLDHAEGWMLISADGRAWYFTSFLYRDAAKAIKEWEVISSSKPIFSEIAELCKNKKFTNLGFEALDIRYSAHKSLAEKMHTAGLKLAETRDIIAKIRSIKSPNEVKKIKQAIQVTLETLQYIGEIHTDTTTEQHLCAEIERFMRLKGDNDTAFPTIVASGKNSAFPHHVPGVKKLSNELFLIDLGAKSCKYCADLTRVFVSSKMPPSFARVHDTVRRAQEAAIKKIRPGAKCQDVDKAAREVITKAGWGKYFGHGVGHGVGLAVHEMPYVGPASDQVLEPGMVITVEPAIYLPGKFGVRIEDMALVTENGVELLSR